MEPCIAQALSIHCNDIQTILMKMIATHFVSTLRFPSIFLKRKPCPSRWKYQFSRQFNRNWHSLRASTYHSSDKHTHSINQAAKLCSTKAIHLSSKSTPSREHALAQPPTSSSCGPRELTEDKRFRQTRAHRSPGCGKSHRAQVCAFSAPSSGPPLPKGITSLILCTYSTGCVRKIFLRWWLTRTRTSLRKKKRVRSVSAAVFHRVWCLCSQSVSVFCRFALPYWAAFLKRGEIWISKRVFRWQYSIPLFWKEV